MKKEKKEFEYYVITFAMIFLLIMGILQILFRFIINFSLSWTEELSRYFFVLMVYTGASLAIKRKRHVTVELVECYIKGKVKEYIFIFNDFIMFTLLVLIGRAGWKIVVSTYEIGQLSPAISLPMYLIYAIIPLTFFIGAFRVFQILVVRIREVRN